jgi:predicted extracellular nuclease
MRSTAWIAIVLATAVWACSGSSKKKDGGPVGDGPTHDVALSDFNGGTDAALDSPGPGLEGGWDTTPPPDGPAPTGATIQQITSGQIAEGTSVLLASVVVTAVDGYGQYTGDVYVQEASGGAGSGTRLYTPSRADGGQIADLKPGDRVKVVGEVKHYAPSGGFNDPKHPQKTHIKELINAKVTFLSAGAAPAPTIVSPQDLVTDPTAEGWEHVLVQVKDVKATSAPNSYGEFDVEGGLTVDDELFAYAAAVGDCLTLAGIPAYFYGYKLLPRAASDVQVSTGCAAPPTLTITDIQDMGSPNHPAENAIVTVTGVVTAVDSTVDSYGNYTGFWIQQTTGGPHSGIYVYHKWTATSPQKPQQGMLVELTGKYTEYYDMSELSNVSWVDKGMATIPAPLQVSAATLAAGGAGAEPYEGVLIQVGNIQVGSYLTDSYGVQIGFSDAATGFKVIHKIYDFMSPTPPAIGTTYSAVIGPLYYAAGAFEIQPRSAADLVP